MISVPTQSATFPVWLARRGSWFLALLVTATIAVPVVGAIGSLDDSFPAPEARSQSPVLALSAAAAMWVLQMRHSLAFARGVRPRGWTLSLVALVALAGVPWLWFSVNWIGATWLPLAAALMVFAGRARFWVCVGSLAMIGTLAGSATVADGGNVVDVVTTTVYNTVFFGFGAGALYWSALLVGRIGELAAARTDLANSVVRGERQRLSRDMHDLLGHSLSAISLKGDLAMRLMPSDRNASSREIAGMGDTARQALQRMHAITHAEHVVTVRDEIDEATALLEAGGVEVHSRLDFPVLDDARAELFGWAVREAATNVLRHSHAQRCWITGRGDGRILRLEVENDGAVRAARAAPGSGVTGLAERARQLGGDVRSSHHRGRFRLVVEVPA